MPKKNIMVPKPNSNFISIQCTECGEKRVAFTHTTMDITCKSCGLVIVKKTGSKANILSKVLSTLD